MEKVFIQDLKEKETVQTPFLARGKKVLVDKKGNTYMVLKLSDSTGEIDARVWDNVDAVKEVFQSGDIITVKGFVQTYQNRKQFVVHKIESCSEEIDLNDYLRATDKNPEDLYQELKQIVSSVADEYIKQLTESVLSDPQIKPLLLRAPAAKSIHHAKIGGLLEHMLSVTKLAVKVADHYEQLNRSLLIFGAIFHDIGKIWELDYNENGIHYTDKGRLIGHMVLAVELVEKKSSQIFNFPEKLKDICKHMILSHHGKLEYGSPKVPQMVEAYMVWLIDDMDSKMDAIFTAMDVNSGREGWSQFSQLFDRHFYLKRDEWDSSDS